MFSIIQCKSRDNGQLTFDILTHWISYNSNVIVVIDWNGSNGSDLTKFGHTTFNGHLLFGLPSFFSCLHSFHSIQKVKKMFIRWMVVKVHIWIICRSTHILKSDLTIGNTIHPDIACVTIELYSRKNTVHYSDSGRLFPYPISFVCMLQIYSIFLSFFFSAELDSVHCFLCQHRQLFHL